MKRFLAKIGRFFWSRGFLKFVLAVIALIVLLYAEEDWRGARTWVATKAYWEAKGETFDIDRLAPPPVADDANLAALPIFKMEPDPDDKGNLAPLKLRQAFKSGTDEDLPRGGDWQAGKMADHEKNRIAVVSAYAKVFGPAPTTMDSLTQFEELHPTIIDLRNAAAMHPYCHFEQNYLYAPPYILYLSLITEQIVLSKFLTADALLALDAKKPDVALTDIKTNFKLASGVTEQPLLVSGLVAIGMTAIDFSAVYEGLASHAWNDAQLADLQSQLARVDFLSNYRRAFRGEACLTITEFDQLKPDRKRLVSELHPAVETNPPTKEHDYSPFVWPDGWIDLLKARAANFDLTAAGFADEHTRTISPAAVRHFETEVEDNERRLGDAFSIWGILSGVAIGPVNRAAQKFAIQQVRMDEARIACALERYRLAHGVYPGTLAELVPACIDEVPHDIMDGEPYHYRLSADGTFLLYSVGWNQTDDGGTVAFEKDNPKAIDYEQGDWVWPTPKYPH